VYFGQALSEDDARSAADGWDGDRLRVYATEGGKQFAVVWATVWDSEQDANEAARAAERVLAKQPESERMQSEVVHRKRAVLILRDLPESVRATLRNAFSDAGFARH
jgi:hypothetical protein